MAIVTIDTERLLSDNGPVAEMILKRVQRGHRVAVEHVRVDTGLLKNSTHYGLGHDGHGLFGFIGSGERHALPNEFGTWFMSAQPFLRPGLAAALED